MNVFDVRTFSQDEKAKIKNVILEGVKLLSQVQDLNLAMKDTVKNLADTLNDQVKEKDLHLKASTISKMIKTKFKEDIEEQKKSVQEIEDGLTQIVG